MEDRRLGRHFWLREFLRSATAARAGRSIENPPKAIVDELERLVALVLDPLRDELGKPITILSGWRPLWLNRMVGGALKSDHMLGRAADLIVAGRGNGNVLRMCQEINLPVRQGILEFPPNGWVHLSIDAPGKGPRLEYLTATKEAGKTVYYRGIR